MNTVMAPVRVRSLATTTARRLLPLEPLGYEAHRAIYGDLSYLDGQQIIVAVELSGLSGQGGAAFPAHRKMTAVREAARRAGRRAVVVANGSEGEPASAKDKALLWHAPHLVLEGVALAAAAVGADRAFLAVESGHGLGRYLTGMSRQRPASAVPVTIVEVPQRFLSGQESALVSFLDGGPALPRYQARPVFERGVGGGPTLVQNVETLAHLALIARHGPGWYRSGAATSLFTVRQADSAPTVVEAMPGTSLGVLAGAGAATGQALLVGGYHGTWLPLTTGATATLSGVEHSVTSANAITPDTGISAATLGVPLGAGLLAVLPHDRCGLIETASVLRYLALESAGQCGPCLNGLPRMAAAFNELAHPTPRSDLRRLCDDLSRWAGLVTGRGACRHPDGSARLARSALIAFAAEIDDHARGRCRAPGRPPMLPTGPAAPAAPIEQGV
ncbi:NADH-ubiquinone oxidoreductase-F iron-sulfur binding region domain-containing protein [Catenulispora rubra]|uniref:NADH-ubiquinone oxidoreductase-F iron-sulfur binding region domain-containing protein n=1 Tax=Catenulispora rubra TaxID=280293 RepID=UPI00189274A9|nr:NADH-ubiquinone oxidoreductase-F iron-sulfur binding region domain-containing protein [Catenulispora rubra]